MTEKLDTADVLENARLAVEAMKEGRTDEYMLSAEGVIVLWDALFQERADRLELERDAARYRVLRDGKDGDTTEKPAYRPEEEMIWGGKELDDWCDARISEWAVASAPKE